MVLSSDSHLPGKGSHVASGGTGNSARTAHRAGSHGREGLPRLVEQRIPGGRQVVDRFLLQVVDGSLAGVIFVVPLLMGGRHAVGQLALTALAVAAAWAWAVRRCFRSDDVWRSTPAMPLVLAGLVLVVLQTVPLPPWLLAVASPRTADLLPLWNSQAIDAASFGPWHCVSFAPAETLAGLVIFLDFAMLFFVAVQRIQNIDDVERILRWCALSAGAMAALGIVQLLTTNGKFLWFYEYPYSDTYGVAKGSFSNRNHFAQFLALGVGPMIWWLQDAMRRRHGQAAGTGASVYLVGLTLGIVLFAGLLSLSRGGMAAMLVAATVCTVVCYKTTSLGKRFIAVLAAAGVLIGVSLAIFGYDRVSNRLDDFTAGSLDELDQSAGRRTIWATTLDAIPNHSMLGTGVGSYRAIYPAYVSEPMEENSVPRYAENGPLQVALETGAVGLFLVLSGMVLCASWCVGGIRASVHTRSKLCIGAIAASLAASAAHALVDFVWYVPACMAVVVILAACAFRVRQIDGERGEGNRSRLRKDPSSLIPHFSFSRAVAAVALTCAGAWMIADRIGPAVAQLPWDEYLVARSAASIQGPKGETAALEDVETQKRWLASLENVVRWQPTHAQAHLKLVETHRRMFDLLQAASENPMSLLQISDTVFNEPQFRSHEALMEWLPRATGDHWIHLEKCVEHARRALTLSPLEGRAYVCLAELSFLWSPDRTAAHAFIAQAMRVRPFDGNVLYAAANMALLEGNEPRWREYLRQAVLCGPQLRRQIMNDRVAGAPPEKLPAVVEDILREFKPGLADAKNLYILCKSRCQPEQLAPLVRYRIERAEAETQALPNAKASEVWLEASQLRRQLGENAEAIQSVRNAVQCDSDNFNAHYHLGKCLLDAESYAEAEAQMRWCLQRKPKSEAVQNGLRQALRGRLDDERRAAKSSDGDALKR